MSEAHPPRVSFSDKDLENGAPNHDRAQSRKWSTAPGAIEDLDEYTALQKYISTYRDPKERAAEEAAAGADGADAGKKKKGWQFWKSAGPKVNPNDASVVPEEWLDADIRQGIANHDVESRRKRYGFNEISSDKENLFIKFLMFFTGPILYGTFSLLPNLSPTHHLSWQFAFCVTIWLWGLH
jgi:H+-transporting ATPase